MLLKLLSSRLRTTNRNNRERLDSCYKAVFNSDAGNAVLEDMLQRSILRLRNPDLSDAELRALSGQAQFVLNILTKLEGE